MQAPRMMAMKVGRANIDVLVAMFPATVEVVANPADIYGVYIVVNVPRSIRTDEFVGVGLTDEVVAPNEFKERFSFVGKETPNKFCTVRQLPESPIQQRVGYNRHTEKTPVNKTLSKQDSALFRLQGHIR